MTQVGPRIDRLPNDADASDSVSHLQPRRRRRQPQDLERRHPLQRGQRHARGGERRRRARQGGTSREAENPAHVWDSI